jgi:hypothetical protein
MNLKEKKRKMKLTRKLASQIYSFLKKDVNEPEASLEEFQNEFCEDVSVYENKILVRWSLVKWRYMKSRVDFSETEWELLDKEHWDFFQDWNKDDGDEEEKDDDDDDPRARDWSGNPFGMHVNDRDWVIRSPDEFIRQVITDPHEIAEFMAENPDVAEVYFLQGAIEGTAEWLDK